MTRIINKYFFIKLKNIILDTIKNKQLIKTTLNAASLAIGISLILCNGPLLQTYSFGLLNSGEASIYSSIYGDDIAKIPDIADWIPTSLISVFFIASIVYFLFARKNNNAREIFISSSVYFFTLLMAIDIFLYSINFSSHKNTNLLECLVANLVGSVALSGCIIIILQIQSSVKNFSENWKTAMSAIALMVPCAFGASSVAIVSYALTIFYKPTYTKIDIVADGKVSLFYWQKENTENKKSEIDGNAESFGFLLDPASTEGRISSTLYDTNPLIVWNKQDRQENYNLSLTFLMGCDDTEKAKKQSSNKNSFTVKNIESLKIHPIEKWSSIYFSKDESNNIKISPGKDGILAWLKNNEEDRETTSLTIGAPDGSRLTLTDTKDRIDFILRSILLNANDAGNYQSESKKIAFVINGETYNFDLTSSAKKGELKSCTPARLTKISTPQNYRVDNPLSISDILISITPETSPNIYYVDGKNAIEVINSGGNIYFDKISYRNLLKSSKNGEIDGARITQDGIKSIRINNEKIELFPLESITIAGGSIKGSFAQNGQIHIYGNAKTAYRGQARLNMTRWERIDTAIKATILSGIATAICFAFTFVAGILRKNKLIDWL
ncbi:hypothetical protein [Pandoraea sputorum]|uniref:Transmembrane protein n=1 Tax=Pandoraea sputorum TaxID=93222 RepID=A0A239SQ69_9BURK|nr:hypothetical protein [Pandoraea sputorum]SNU87018.1 Uncharacterised protein [Pandoraea sputorum]